MWTEGDTFDKYDAFISYRVKPDASQARLLSDCLGMQSMTEQGRAPAVFLDQKSLVAGERWDSFATALANSATFIPFISRGTLDTMVVKVSQGSQDNVLLEWSLAIEVPTSPVTPSLFHSPVIP